MAYADKSSQYLITVADLKVISVGMSLVVLNISIIFQASNTNPL